jgi:hypothetical protein
MFFLKWNLILITTMTFVSSIYDENENFYDYHPKDLTLWHTFLFSFGHF